MIIADSDTIGKLNNIIYVFNRLGLFEHRWRIEFAKWSTDKSGDLGLDPLYKIHIIEMEA